MLENGGDRYVSESENQRLLSCIKTFAGVTVLIKPQVFVGKDLEGHVV